MFKIRKSQDRGHANHGWLDSYHSFSFAEYYDSAHMGYSVLRVINEDTVAGGAGFGMHSHKDMEIVTFILYGELRHQDSMGNITVLVAGDVQRMTAGTGVRHSEFNASSNQPVHLLQIWINPAQNKLTPSYEEKNFSIEKKQNRWCLIVSPNGHDGSIKIHQNASIYASLLAQGNTLTILTNQDRCAYLQVAIGSVMLNEQILLAGDAVMIAQSACYEIIAQEDSELLLFDLPTF